MVLVSVSCRTANLSGQELRDETLNVDICYKFLVLMRTGTQPEGKRRTERSALISPEASDTHKIDVSAWELGKDAVILSYVEIDEVFLIPYPWNGEDTIRYYYDGEELWGERKTGRCRPLG